MSIVLRCVNWTRMNSEWKKLEQDDDMFGLIYAAFAAGCKKVTRELSFTNLSGIITTILGKTATSTKGAGRERRVHHSKSLPLPNQGERLFFWIK
jgi:hypothetical protein